MSGSFAFGRGRRPQGSLARRAPLRGGTSPLRSRGMWGAAASPVNSDGIAPDPTVRSDHGHRSLTPQFEHPHTIPHGWLGEGHARTAVDRGHPRGDREDHAEPRPDRIWVGSTLLVREGFYANRSDFIRQGRARAAGRPRPGAARGHDPGWRSSSAVRRYGVAELEARRDAGRPPPRPRARPGRHRAGRHAGTRPGGHRLADRPGHAPGQRRGPARDRRPHPVDAISTPHRRKERHDTARHPELDDRGRRAGPPGPIAGGHRPHPRRPAGPGGGAFAEPRPLEAGGPPHHARHHPRAPIGPRPSRGSPRTADRTADRTAQPDRALRGARAPGPPGADDLQGLRPGLGGRARTLPSWRCSTGAGRTRTTSRWAPA